MKLILVLGFLSFVAAGFARADVQIIRSPVTGTAVQVPDGFLQIIKPGFIIEDGTEGVLLKADQSTATAICKSLGRAFVGYQAINSYSGVPVVSFTSAGLLNLNRAPADTISIIDVLTCR